MSELRYGRAVPDTTVRAKVLDFLRQEIVEQRFEPGQRLIERELVEEIGVSRTTVREVLRQLDAEGLVRTTPQRGAIVAVPTPGEAAELYEVRAALEALAARRFVAHASDAQVRALRDAFEAIERVAVNGDIAAIVAAKDRFYDVLLAGSRSHAVAEILSELQARVSLLRRTSLGRPGRAARSLEEIRAIVEAVEARDAAGAARAAARHVEQAARAGLGALRP